MVFEEEFKFLKVDRRERKESEKLKDENKYYFVIHLLDKDNNPCSFFSFNSELNKNILADLSNVKGLQDVLVKFELVFNNNIWNVRLLNIDFSY